MGAHRAVIAVALASAACGNVSGHISAKRTGDTSHPAERGSPVASLRAACGEDVAMPPGLDREPYLQQVTLSSATVGWVSDEANEQIVLTTPDGGPVANVTGVADDVPLRSAADHQLWSALENLSPGSTYCYQLAGTAGMMTPRTAFRTAPAADDPAPVRFLAFGDSGGGGADQYALLEQMYTVPFDLMIHTGDVAYEDGTIGQYEDNVFGVYADLFRNLPFFPAAGNHDYHTLSGAPFEEVFALPGQGDHKWYSFDWGPVHFVALDTEADYATQAAWLDTDLTASERPWTIVYMHRPLYSSGSHGSDTTLRNKLAPVLKRHDVQLVLSGHDHDYERVLPQDGTTYVVTGGGGVGTKSVGASGFTAFSLDVIHFVYVEVAADELTLHAIDATGREFDSVVVPRT